MRERNFAAQLRFPRMPCNTLAYLSQGLVLYFAGALGSHLCPEHVLRKSTARDELRWGTHDPSYLYMSIVEHLSGLDVSVATSHAVLALGSKGPGQSSPHAPSPDAPPWQPSSATSFGTSSACSSSQRRRNLLQLAPWLASRRTSLECLAA